MTGKEKQRFMELDNKAKDNFMESSDFTAEDWLENEDEKIEYTNLFNKFLDSLTDK